MPPIPARLRALAAACLLPLAVVCAASSLPVSILNELDVVIENGRNHLANAQLPSGLWSLGETESTLPAFAFLGTADDSGAPPRVLRAAVEAAFRRLTATAFFATHSTDSSVLAEDALVVAAALSVHGTEAFPSIASADEGVLRAVRTRLLHADSARQASSTAWLGRCALELLPGRAESSADWAPLFRRTMESPAGLSSRDVAIAGYARLRHGTGADSSGAVLAHLRWLRLHEPLLSDDSQPSGATPEDLYYLALFLDNAPPALVASAGITPRWRVRLAQHLIATARSDGHSGAFWRGDADALRPSLYAVATLDALAR